MTLVDGQKSKSRWVFSTGFSFAPNMSYNYDGMKETMKVRICPFCGHHGHELLYTAVDVRYEDGEHDTNDIWQLECKCCGARGPTEYTPRFAIESWNVLYRKPAHNDDPMEDDFTFDADSIKRKVQTHV